jgi:hypothetical protein
MTASRVHLPSSVSPGTEARAGWLHRLNGSTAGGNGHTLRPPVVPGPPGFPRRTAGARASNWRHARAAEAWHCEEDWMRLFAALLVLATLLLWMLFLQG